MPFSASAALPKDAMELVLSPHSRNLTQASTFGPMLPARKCPSFMYRFA